MLAQRASSKTSAHIIGEERTSNAAPAAAPRRAPLLLRLRSVRCSVDCASLPEVDASSEQPTLALLLHCIPESASDCSIFDDKAVLCFEKGHIKKIKSVWSQHVMFDLDMRCDGCVKGDRDGSVLKVQV